MTYTGIVKWFSKEKGYGFLFFDVSTINPDAPEYIKEIASGSTKVKVYDGIAQVMAHITEVEGMKYLNEGELVTFDFRKGKHGALASNIKINK